MANVNYRKLIQLYESQGDRARTYLRESFQAKEIRPADFDFGKLFAEAFGWGEFQRCRGSGYLAHDVMEAAGAVATNAFQNISGQVVYSAIMEEYDTPEYVFSKLIPSQTTPFSGEKIPGITNIGPEALVVPEGEEYPIAGVSEDYVETAPTRKRGLLVPVTREAVFFDRTGILLDRCREVGRWLGYDKELRAIDCVIDENTGAASAMLGGHRYHWRGTSIATYGNNSGTHTWDNLEASNALVDYTDIEKAELLLAAMTDPNTGVITGKYRAAAQYLICTTQLIHTAKQILSATEIRLHAGGYPTSGNLYERGSANTLQSYQILSTPLVESRLATDTSWFFGNPAKAFRYMENWPMQIKEAPANSHDEFHRDIVSQFRADERGAYATVDPRYMVTSTA